MFFTFHSKHWAFRPPADLEPAQTIPQGSLPSRPARCPATQPQRRVPDADSSWIQLLLCSHNTRSAWCFEPSASFQILSVEINSAMTPSLQPRLPKKMLLQHGTRLELASIPALCEAALVPTCTREEPRTQRAPLGLGSCLNHVNLPVRGKKQTRTQQKVAHLVHLICSAVLFDSDCHCCYIW